MQVLVYNFFASLGYKLLLVLYLVVQYILLHLLLLLLQDDQYYLNLIFLQGQPLLKLLNNGRATKKWVPNGDDPGPSSPVGPKVQPSASVPKSLPRYSPRPSLIIGFEIVRAPQMFKSPVGTWDGRARDRGRAYILRESACATGRSRAPAGPCFCLPFLNLFQKRAQRKQ